MNVGQLECKDNNAVHVKRIMPDLSCGLHVPWPDKLLQLLIMFQPEIAKRA
jgi:hypothetical protein